MIPLSNPKVRVEIIKAIEDTINNEYFVMGESVYKFEEEFAKYIGTDHAISTGSGTSALQLSLIALKAKGTEVITTPNTFIATSNSIIHAEATPVFSDIDPNTGNIDENKLIDTIKKNPKASGILPVHIYGNPCNMDTIKEIAEKNNQFILEDACQAHGAEYRNRKVGSIGDVGCFSFYTTKNLTVLGDGGMITTSNEKIAKEVSVLRDCGRISKYEHSVIGYTSRLNTINAAIGRIHLKHLDDWNEQRRTIAKRYKKLLGEDKTLKETADSKCVYHLFILKVEASLRDALIDHLKKEEIQTGIHYPIPVHLQPAYRQRYNYTEGMLPQSESFAKEIISLPMYPDLKDEDINTICEKIHEVLS
ncbi:MAG: DegT/DnrJ/EryC1/StrS family aminotransferase [archaeon]